MYILRHLAVSLTLALSALSSVHARAAKHQPRSPARTCNTNTECLQMGLPPLPPRRAQARRPVRRQFGQAFVPVSTTTCGTEETVFLPTGQYQVSVSGAGGAANGRTGTNANPGGNGASFAATLVVTNNITVGYFVGCSPFPAPGNTGGSGGGATFLYIIGPSQPAILVAGAGGGGGYYPNGPGRNAGITLDGTATLSEGSPGATGGAGGSSSTNVALTGGSGGGFITAGSSSTSFGTTYEGGSQSTNYGGTFAGGRYNGVPAGGTGGGGSRGFNGGGGGGGYSGGSGGIGTDSEAATGTGGGGGGSYANGASPRGITVTAGAVTATVTTQGSLIITKLA